MNSYNRLDKMNTQPRLGTIEMVKKSIRKYSGEYSKYQLWKRLTRKTMYQTYNKILDYLLANKEIIIRNDRKIEYRPISEKFELSAIDREMLLYNLSNYGYELISLKKLKKREILPIEELIMQILIRFPEARFIEAIPILIIKNRIDKFELYRIAYDYGLLNKIGFLLDMSFRIAQKRNTDISYLKELLQAFRLKKEQAIQSFSISEDKQFLGKNTQKEMKNWNLIGLFSLSDFRDV